MTPGDEDWYLMHRMQSYDWPYSKVSSDSSKELSFRAAVLHAAVFLLQLFSLSLWGLWRMQVLWDKPKYSGPGKKKQCSLKWCCLAMKAEILSPPSSKRKEQGRKNINFTMLHHHLTLASSFLCFRAYHKGWHIFRYFSVFSHNSSWLSNQSGHMLHPVKEDGNCMFWCFSHYLLGMRRSMTQFKHL